MLEAARQRKMDGVDVVVAFVDTHGQSEPDALLREMEVIPPIQLEPGQDGAGAALAVDAVLARRPVLALVDDLESSNPPGARHLHRYQDVEDLLNAGINVYATLNVQHLASLSDVVRQITGLSVTDTVPDSLLDEASEIEVVDLPPDELLERMREGRVFVPEQIRASTELLYRKGNLTALRELALLRAAERVDDQMRAYMQTQAIVGPWPAGERLLVCVSGDPLGERLVRTARRLADDLNAPWYAVFVETSSYRRNPLIREQVLHILQLAESLGGQVVMLAGGAVAPAVMEFAQKNNITKIIAGKPKQPRWLELLRGSTVDQIIRLSGLVDVYVISSEPGSIRPVLAERFLPHRPVRRYILSFLLAGLATLISWPVSSFLDPITLVMFYLIAVVIAAIYLGRGPSVLTSLLSVMAYELLFVVPRLGFSFSDIQYFLTFTSLLMVGWVISTMAAIARDQVAASQRRETQTAALSIFSRELTQALSLDDVLKVILKHVSQTFSREVVIFVPENGVLRLRASTANMQLAADELRVIHWAFDHGEHAGRRTETMPHVRLHAIPLLTSRGTVGVMGIIPPDPSSYLDPDQRWLMESFASLSALALERGLLAEQASQTQVLQAAERLQTALLNSISHDLRTPLSSITGVLSSLKENPNSLEDPTVFDDETRAELIDTALEEAGRLNRLVANLLDMTRLEAGALHLKREPCDVQDLVGAALARLRDRLANRTLETVIPDDLPLVPLDFVTMNQVLINLLDNAVKYSLPRTTIKVKVFNRLDGIHICVSDEGIGIPQEDLERVFDKFYWVQRPDGISGTGLGLSICKGIVEAHDGRIWAEIRPGGGTKIEMVLPVP